MTELDLKLLTWIVDAQKALVWIRDHVLLGTEAWPGVDEVIKACPLDYTEDGL